MAHHSFPFPCILHFSVTLLSIFVPSTKAARNATTQTIESIPPVTRSRRVQRLVYAEDHSDQPALTSQSKVAVSDNSPVDELPKASAFADLSALSALSTTPVDLPNRRRAAAIAGSLTGGFTLLLSIALFLLYRKRRRERRQKLRVQRPYYDVNTEVDRPKPLKKPSGHAKVVQPQSPVTHGPVASPDVTLHPPSLPDRTHNRQKSSKNIRVSLQRRAAFAADSGRGPDGLGWELGHRRERGERQWDDIPVREGRLTMSTICTVSAPPAYDEPSYPLPALPASRPRTVRSILLSSSPC
ncbi:hypothetical protein FA13DRAFT_1790978 [Coprinellus micaceus]|uniref:Transmembrane protein n=1 Tax=Coprinellus micaceus TaxID=71717 RepID=A0A4Y7TDA4_COPMI|nr:hypothetical protein FA13DRAFT_1790978 [Coprinellus micaceus]